MGKRFGFLKENQERIRRDENKIVLGGTCNAMGSEYDGLGVNFRVQNRWEI